MLWALLLLLVGVVLGFIVGPWAPLICGVVLVFWVGRLADRLDQLETRLQKHGILPEETGGGVESYAVRLGRARLAPRGKFHARQK